MSCVHYKFFSRLGYDIITFSGPSISLGDLKCQIMAREKLKAAHCDLQISNAQTGEEYADENTLVPRNMTVIVRRIPAAGVKAARKPSVLSRREPVSGTSKAINDDSTPLTLEQLIKTADLAGANASEEDKIKAMMIQSCQMYNTIDPYRYRKKSLPSDTSFPRGIPGRSIKNGPADGGKSLGSVPRIRMSTGIPRSFLVEVEDPKTKGALLTRTGKYAVPIINMEAYAREKKKKPTLLPEEPPSSSSNPTAEEQPPLPPPPPPLVAVSLPTAPVCPVQRQPASLSLPGPQGQSMPAAAHPKPGRRTRSAGGRAGWEPEKKKSKLDGFTNNSAEELVQNKKIQKARRRSLSRSKSPYSAPSHSRGLHTCSKSRSGSSSSHAYSRAFNRSDSHSYLPYPLHPGRGKGGSCKSGWRSRSRGYARSRSRSPLYRRHHSRPASPAFRGHSPAQRTRPRGAGERECFNRYPEVPPHSRKAQRGRALELREPSENERDREWERNHRERHKKYL